METVETINGPLEQVESFDEAAAWIEDHGLVYDFEANGDIRLHYVNRAGERRAVHLIGGGSRLTEQEQVVMAAQNLQWRLQCKGVGLKQVVGSG